MLRRLAIPFTCAVLLVPASSDAATYTWNPSASTILVRTDRGGLFGRMGHRHEIRAQSFTGTIELDPSTPAAAKIDLVIAAKSLKVVDHDLEAKDVAKVQSDMEAKVLEVEKHAEIRFTSEAVTPQGQTPDGAGWRLIARGTLALHGVTKPLSAPITITMEEAPHAEGTPATGGFGVRLKGTAIVKQTDFGIEPISVGLGAVTVKDEVKIELDLFADAPTAGGTPPTGTTAAPDTAAQSSPADTAAADSTSGTGH